PGSVGSDDRHPSGRLQYDLRTLPVLRSTGPSCSSLLAWAGANPRALRSASAPRAELFRVGFRSVGQLEAKMSARCVSRCRPKPCWRGSDGSRAVREPLGPGFRVREASAGVLSVLLLRLARAGKSAGSALPSA